MRQNCGHIRQDFLMFQIYLFFFVTSHFNLDMKTSWAETNIVTCAGVVWDWNFQPLWVNPNIWLYLVEVPIILNPISRFSSPLKWVLNSMAVKNPGTLALTGWLVDVYFLLSMVMTGFDPFPYWLVVWNIFIFFHVLGIIIPTDEHIFFRGVETTNQHIFHDLFSWNPKFLSAPHLSVVYQGIRTGKGKLAPCYRQLQSEGGPPAG